MKCINRVMTGMFLLVGGSALMLAGCDVDQTQEGELPEVTAEGGQLPEYDVDTADVDVGTREETITVPDVDVTMPDEQPDDDEVPAEDDAPPQ